MASKEFKFTDPKFIENLAKMMTQIEQMNYNNLNIYLSNLTIYKDDLDEEINILTTNINEPNPNNIINKSKSPAFAFFKEPSDSPVQITEKARPKLIEDYREKKENLESIKSIIELAIKLVNKQLLRTAPPGGGGAGFKKYLKYKAKYLQLKNQLN